jgi:hypothetical protein
MMKNKLIICFFWLAILSGCGTTEVIKNPTSNGYLVSSQYGALNGSWDRASAEAMEKGRAYCVAQGKQFELIGEQRSGVVGWSPQVSAISFECSDGKSKTPSISLD